MTGSITFQFRTSSPGRSGSQEGSSLINHKVYANIFSLRIACIAGMPSCGQEVFSKLAEGPAIYVKSLRGWGFPCLKSFALACIFVCLSTNVPLATQVPFSSSTSYCTHNHKTHHLLAAAATHRLPSPRMEVGRKCEADAL